jgi:prophage regulatory protein
MTKTQNVAEARIDDAEGNRPPAALDVPRLIRLPEVLRRVPLKRSTIYSRVAQGTFPRPVRLGSPHAVAWVTAEINQWIDEQIHAAKVESRTSRAIPE